MSVTPLPVLPQHEDADRRRTSWTATELMVTEFAEIRWAVRGLLAEGANMLAGAPKLGKSWLALCIAISVASGGRALGRIQVERGDVLYLALEDTPRRLQDRLRSILGDDAAPGRLTISIECEPLDQGGTERIEAWLEEHHDARLVVIDVLTRVRSKTSDRANRYEVDYQTMAAVKAIADRHGVAFLVVHHVRKAHAEDFIDSVSGTNGLAGAADAVLVLTRSRTSTQATLKITGRDVEEAEYALEFTPDVGTWTLLDGPAADYELRDTRRAIVQLLRENEGLTPTLIADKLGLKANTVTATCRRMVEADQLDTDGDGHYFPLSPVIPVTLSLDPNDTSDSGDNPLSHDMNDGGRG